MLWKGLDIIGMNMGGIVDFGFVQVKMIQVFYFFGIVFEEEQ